MNILCKLGFEYCIKISFEYQYSNITTYEIPVATPADNCINKITTWGPEDGDRGGTSRPSKNKGIKSPSLGVSGPSSYFT